MVVLTLGTIFGGVDAARTATAADITQPPASSRISPQRHSTQPVAAAPNTYLGSSIHIATLGLGVECACYRRCATHYFKVPQGKVSLLPSSVFRGVQVQHPRVSKKEPSALSRG